MMTKTCRAVALGLCILTWAPCVDGGPRQSAAKNSDFGPSPDTLELPTTIETDDGFEDRVPRRLDLHRNRSRLPAVISPFDDKLPIRHESQPAEDGILRRVPVRLRGGDAAPPLVPQRQRDVVTLNENLTRRYQDPRVVRVLTELTSSTGEAFFREVSEMIDRRHIEPTSYGERINQGCEHLKVAIENSAFQEAVGIRPTPEQIRLFREDLRTIQRTARTQNQTEAVQVLRQSARVGQQTLGLNPGAVCLEFVYASLESLDKFSMLLPPEKSGGVNVGLDENVVGIGVEVAADDAGLKIVKTIPGGPAAIAAIKKGDVITAVNGRDLQGLSMGQAVDLITGRAGTAVRLSLQRESLVADITLVRRSVMVHSVSEVRMLDSADRVGYVKLEQFAESSARELDAALWKLHRAGMETLVIDLRGNPGGYLTTAIEISDRFLPAGTIVSTRGRTPDDDSEETATYPQTWKTPLVVLIDHGSASASEIFAAAIQENDRGLIVGETSYGKGTVQTLFPLQNVTAGLRLTTAKFYSPDGREMAGEGVIPDIRVRTGRRDDDDAVMLEAAIEAARDPRLQEMAQKLPRPGRTGMREMEFARTGRR